MDLPGFRADEVEILLEGDRLSITANKAESDAAKVGALHCLSQYLCMHGDGGTTWPFSRWVPAEDVHTIHACTASVCATSNIRTPADHLLPLHALPPLPVHPTHQARSVAFPRSFGLPDNVRQDDISASLDKGVLTVILPKATPTLKTEPKTVPVQAGPAKPAAAAAEGGEAPAEGTTAGSAQEQCTYRPWGRCRK